MGFRFLGSCCLILSFFRLLSQYKRLAWLGLLFLLSIHSLKTHLRNADWKDEYTVFTAGLKVNQRNAKLFNNVGHALESEGRFREALAYFQAAVSVQKDDIGAHINVGRTYNNLKRYIDAEDAYLKVGQCAMISAAVISIVASTTSFIGIYILFPMNWEWKQCVDLTYSWDL